jgi:outer membrane cobalamin receptor
MIRTITFSLRSGWLVGMMLGVAVAGSRGVPPARSGDGQALSDPEPETATIRGFVRERATGEPIAYANVFLAGTPLGNSTNQDGYYVITGIPSGEYEVVASFIGYVSQRIPVELQEGAVRRLDFRLEQTALPGEEVTVTAQRQQFRRLVEPSRVQLDRRTIAVAPAFVEADVFRTAQMLPGVQTLNDFTSALYVRGGTPDQNLILLDGITIYHPFHLGGVFSTFNTDAIKEADFRLGGFPVRHGGRMGSVLNIINREGNTEEVTGKAGVSLLSSKLLVEGPLPRWNELRGSWMAAGRRTYFDRIIALGLAVANKLNENNPNWDSSLPGFPYHFYDLVGKVNLDLNPDHRLTLSTYYGDDVLHVDMRDRERYFWDENGDRGGWIDTTRELIDWRWGNFVQSVTWRWLLTPRMVLKTFLAGSRFRFRIDMDFTDRTMNIFGDDSVYTRQEVYFDAFDVVRDGTVETELTWTPHNRRVVTTGFQHKSLTFTLGVHTAFYDQEDTVVSARTDTAMWIRQEAAEQSLYLQERRQVTARLAVQYGLRLYHYSLHRSLYLDPRLGLKYFLQDNLSLKLSVGRYHQFLAIVNPPDMNLAYVDIWMPLPADRPASYGDHLVLGMEYLTARNLLLRVEAYGKRFKHLLTLKNPESVITMDEAEETFRVKPFNEFWDTDGRAWGLELLVQKSVGKVRGWVGYTFAATQRRTRVDDWYYPNYDRTHTLNLVADWQWTERIHLSTAVTYMSGNPYTPIIGRGEQVQEYSWEPNLGYGWEQQWLVGKKNSARYPPYFRWDVSLVSRKKTRRGYREWYFQLLNITNHLNVLYYFYADADNATGWFGSRKRLAPGVYRLGIPMFPITPTFGWRYEF